MLLSLLTDSLARSSIKHFRVSSRCLVGATRGETCGRAVRAAGAVRRPGAAPPAAAPRAPVFKKQTNTETDSRQQDSRRLRRVSTRILGKTMRDTVRNKERWKQATWRSNTSTGVIIVSSKTSRMHDEVFLGPKIDIPKSSIDRRGFGEILRNAHNRERTRQAHTSVLWPNTKGLYTSVLFLKRLVFV